MRGAVELRDVGFRYDPRAPWTLQGISLKIEPGQKVALVGSSGSGKSTLARLLPALHTPTTGEILYDGVPVNELNLRTLRRQFGVVTQDPSLFTGTIRENIALDDPGRWRRIVEWGTHDRLLAYGGRYAALVAAQTVHGPRRDGLPSTAKEQWQGDSHSLPFSIYSATGGLRQDPGRAAESPTEART